MNKNVELEIQKVLFKVSNQIVQVEEIEQKLLKLQEHLIKLKQGIHQEMERLDSLGTKTPRRDGNPSTPEELKQKEIFNLQLRSEKLRLIEMMMPAEKKEKINSLLPDNLRNI